MRIQIRDPESYRSGMEKIRIRDLGWKKFGSGIRDKHPGSADLIPVYHLLLPHAGNIYTNYSAADLDGVSNPAWRPLYNRIWDVTDIIVPPVENNAFFITTNIVITPNQARGECAERAAVAPCRTGTDCPAGRAASNLGSGVNTGVCNTTTGSCQVYAWCPLGTVRNR
jgi:hypothetical protein